MCADLVELLAHGDVVAVLVQLVAQDMVALKKDPAAAAAAGGMSRQLAGDLILIGPIELRVYRNERAEPTTTPCAAGSRAHVSITRDEPPITRDCPPSSSNITRDDPPITRDCLPSSSNIQGRSSARAYRARVEAMAAYSVYRSAGAAGQDFGWVGKIGWLRFFFGGGWGACTPPPAA